MPQHPLVDIAFSPRCWGIDWIYTIKISIGIGKWISWPFPADYRERFEGETCCSNGVTQVTEGSAVLVRELQFQLPASKVAPARILVPPLHKRWCSRPSMLWSFAGFAFIFFWFGSRNMFIYIYLYLFTFISEWFMLFLYNGDCSSFRSPENDRSCSDSI